eukprot:TRINITY_DN6895_c0_g1_i1.p1 TRINITY_DN6895_c0_g1~~TRINITY_DN6895_c0_g1_i1.p1  ORF type:complete len:615 (+),score=106.54 TRINITY_DN6895_c0_g1_i1:61-1905(+)
MDEGEELITKRPATASPRRLENAKKELKVPPRWAGPVQVKMTGMDPSVLLPVECDEGIIEGGKVNLLNINESEGKILDSPRSMEACLRLGILPEEIVSKPLEYFLMEHSKNGTKRLSKTDTECAKAHYEHYETRRMMKLETLMEERNNIIKHSMQLSLTRTSKKSRKASALFALEESKLKKLVDANQTMLRQRLLHESKVASIREQREQALEQERLRDEKMKAAQRQESAKNELETAVRQKLSAAKKLLEKRQQQAALLKKQRTHQQKEELRKKQVEEKKKSLEEQNRARSCVNEERQKQIHQQNKMLQEGRRLELLGRIERTEEIKLLQDKQRVDALQERREQAAMKQSKIKAALERSAAAREQKVSRALEKEAKANMALDDFEKTRSKLLLEKRSQDEEKEKRRKIVYKEAMRLVDERKNQIISKKLTQEKHFAVLQKKKANEKKLRSNQIHLKVRDRVDNVARMKKVVEFKKYLTVEKIESKNRKVEEIREEKEKLKEKRSRHRAAIEAARIPLKTYSPGPGDYTTQEAVCQASSPQWKFGLAPSNLAMRVITPDGVVARGSAPGYVSSPGPCAYSQPSPSTESYRRRAPAFAVSKAPRFNESFIGPDDSR